MSSTVGKELHLTYGNATTYLSSNDSSATVSNVQELYGYTVLFKSKTSNSTINFTSAANNVLYPNSIVHPTSAKFRYYYACASALGTSTISTYFDNTNVWSTSKKGDVIPSWAETTTTDSSVLNSTKSTELKLVVGNSSSLSGTYILDYIELDKTQSLGAYITLYFTRYNFTSITGPGIASTAIISNCVDGNNYGYDGDTVTYTCTLQPGVTFDGWYNGSTKVSSSQSYTHTVNGSDLALQARATNYLYGVYGGNTIFGVAKSSGNAIVTYNNNTLTTLSKGTSKTIKCNGNKMIDNVVIDTKTLKCKDKIMRSDVFIEYI